jgi:hypothetical protein
MRWPWVSMWPASRASARAITRPSTRRGSPPADTARWRISRGPTRCAPGSILRLRGRSSGPRSWSGSDTTAAKVAARRTRRAASSPATRAGGTTTGSSRRSCTRCWRGSSTSWAASCRRRARTSTRVRCSNASSRGARGSAGSAGTRCSSIRGAARTSFSAHCSSSWSSLATSRSTPIIAGVATRASRRVRRARCSDVTSAARRSSMRRAASRT